MLPGRTTAVQSGFGHVARASNCSSVGAVAVSGLIVSLPFCGESNPLDVEVVVVCVCDSTGLFGLTPGLKQSTIAEYVTLRSAVAFVWPTPASSNAAVGQVTLRSAPTVQTGVGVPCTKCVPCGAAA